jgi:hypothetical protein
MKTKYWIIAANMLLAFNAYAGDYKLTCNMPNNKMCGDNTFSSESMRDQFVAHCKSAGGEVLSGSCPAGPSCLFADGDHTTKSYDYSLSASVLEQNCKLQGGKFSAR